MDKDRNAEPISHTVLAVGIDRLEEVRNLPNQFCAIL